MAQTDGEVGIPTNLVFHSTRSVIKMKYDSSRRAINHSGLGGRVGEEECAWELRLDLRIRCLDGKGKEPTPTRRTRKGVMPLVGLWGIIIIEQRKKGGERETLPLARKGTAPQSPGTRRAG
ncbi:hypothetical protein AVEN_5067-1 [Araneus ventricosus]|uniref:Uncharacterized protein n=1 Tax=Araneus ventricosus TaxID=182803 RepID=A0A4Y2LD43_ARAVE|nr:hypothetical protein AVEN_5067-1 [Araneus ventricosus]